MKKNPKKFLTHNLIQRFFRRWSRYRPKGAVLDGRLNKTIKALLKKPVFEKGNGKWFDELNAVIEQYDNKEERSPELTPIRPSPEKIEGYGYQILIQKKKNRIKNYTSRFSQDCRQ